MTTKASGLPVDCDEGVVGIRHHVLLKPNRRSSLVGSQHALWGPPRKSIWVANNRPETVGGTPEEQIDMYRDWPKAVAFADSHSVVSRWANYLLDDEVTTYRGRMSNTKPVERMPYSTWYHEPLARGIPGFAEQSACADVCTACKSSEYGEPVLLMSHLARRFQHGNENAGEIHSFLHPEAHGIDIEVSGLDTCPHLRWGTCWWFSDHEVEDLELAPGESPISLPVKADRPGSPGHHAWRDSLRIRRETSANRRNAQIVDGMPDFSADVAFRGHSRSAFPIGPGQHGQEIGYDVVVATPTLEVGVDMNTVTEVYTHKAIRNISSYRRPGRAGRERRSEVLLGTTLGHSSRDLKHLRSPNALVVNPVQDPIPTAPRNTAVLESQLYATALFLAGRRAPAILRLTSITYQAVEQGFHDVHDAISAGEFREHLVGLFGGYATNAQIDEALATLQEHISFFLDDVQVGDETWSVARWICNPASTHGFHQTSIPGDGGNAGPQLINLLEALGIGRSDVEGIFNSKEDMADFITSRVPEASGGREFLLSVTYATEKPRIVAEIEAATLRLSNSPIIQTT